MPKETFGKQLQRVRQAANLSQAKLAKAAGIPVGTLRNLEQGRRIPRLDTAMKLARALGVSIDELTGDGGAEEKRKRGK
jgi:transcriptional regulator with XRE-family HTH domain